MFLYWKTHTHSLYQRSPSVSIHVQGFRGSTSKQKMTTWQTLTHASPWSSACPWGT